MPPTRVVNLGAAPYDVYIGRGSMWGNPFSHVRSVYTVTLVPTRAEAIRRYSEWIREQPPLLAMIHELKGKVLGCYCKPLACHGDVLAALANDLDDDQPLK